MRGCRSVGHLADTPEVNSARDDSAEAWVLLERIGQPKETSMYVSASVTLAGNEERYACSSNIFRAEIIRLFTVCLLACIQITINRQAHSDSYKPNWPEETFGEANK
jgi:hypothetical protein